MKSKFVTLTAKFKRENLVEVVVHNAHTGKIHHLLWEYDEDKATETVEKGVKSK